MTQKTIPLHDFVSLVCDYAAVYDITAATRLYAQWCKSNVPAEEFIKAHLPSPAHISVAAVCNSNDIAVLARAQKWLKRKKAVIIDTVNGPYVDTEHAAQLADFLHNAIALYPYFVDCCNRHCLPITPATYNRFASFCKENVIKTNCHPLEPQYTEFWIGPVQDLSMFGNTWATEENIDVPLCEESEISVGEAARQLNIKPRRLLDWLYAHPSYFTADCGFIILDREWVDLIARVWKDAAPVGDILDTILSSLPSGKRSTCKADAMTWIRKHSHSWLLNPDQYPQHPGGMYVSKEDEEKARKDLVAYIYSLPAWPLGVLKESTGYPTAKLKDLAKRGNVSGAIQPNGDYLISTNELHRIQDLASQYISLDEIVTNIVHNDDRFNIRLSAHRADLKNFCSQNDWWGLCVTSGTEYPINSGLCNTLVLKTNADELKGRLSSWLLGYRQDHKTQLTLLLEHYQAQYPNTVTRLRQYYANVEITKAIVDMADFLLYLLPQKELQDTTEKEIEEIVRNFADQATLESSRILVAFLYESNITRKQYEFDGTGVTIDTSAYTVADFAVMVAPVVNEGVIAELNLVKKAVDSPKGAALWLYVALHIFAAWRDTDYTRLMAPVLNYAPAIVLKMIRDGTYTDDDAIRVANQFIAEHKLMWMRPNKTKSISGVAPLYFLCPEDCKAIFGVILSISAAHYYLSNKAGDFVSPVRDRATISMFFGPVFLAACGGKNFSGRRANKALMQAVEFEGREDGRYNPLVAYSLASQMRSHKANYGKLAETTDIYLRDANFSGLSPDYVLYQMFQRGVCSFVVDVMLNQCYGEQYAPLSVAAKTEVIRSIGVPVSKMDIALRSAQAAMDTAVATVQSLSLDKQDMVSALRTIAAGRAHGKDMDVQCIAKATDQGCKCPNRLNCLGCKYEITTKALLLKYLVAHRDCQKTASSETDNNRNKWLDNNVILPKIAEIAEHMRSASDVDELQLYIDLIKEVESDGFTSSCAG